MILYCGCSLLKGCNLKKGSQCQIVQVHVRLLSVILYESDEP
jgi:hypothetical protein